MYQAQLPEGVSEIIIFVEDMDGNIVNDTIRAENLGLEPAIELNVSGLTMWLITIFLGAMAGYMLVKTDMWERANEQKKRYVKFGIAGVVIGILTILSIFGQFPATFTKLNEIIATAESSIQGYGLLITIVGVSVGSLAGVGLIYWGLKRRNMI